MATTVRDLMHAFPPRIITFDDEATVSSKQWVAKYPPFHPQYVIHHEPTNAVIERILGPSEDTPSAADFIGLEAPASLLNHVTQVVSREGEVTRDFDQNLGLPLALAFSPDSPFSPTLWSRSLVGRRNETSSMKTIDYQMMMPHSKRKLGLAAAAGEMKSLGVIDPLEWKGKAGMSAKTAKLQQELRGQAWIPFAVVFGRIY